MILLMLFSWEGQNYREKLLSEWKPSKSMAGEGIITTDREEKKSRRRWERNLRNDPLFTLTLIINMVCWGSDKRREVLHWKTHIQHHIQDKGRRRDRVAQILVPDKKSLLPLLLLSEYYSSSSRYFFKELAVLPAVFGREKSIFGYVETRNWMLFSLPQESSLQLKLFFSLSLPPNNKTTKLYFNCYLLLTWLSSNLLHREAKFNFISLFISSQSIFLYLLNSLHTFVQ